jgi:hypothetical protein
VDDEDRTESYMSPPAHLKASGIMPAYQFSIQVQEEGRILKDRRNAIEMFTHIKFLQNS